jgi:hypothetical protein
MAQAITRVKSKSTARGAQKVFTVGQLRRWNVSLAVLHAVQAIAILLLSTNRSFPITLSYLTQDTIQTKLEHTPVLAPATHQLFSLNLSYVIALFFILSAIAHLLMATVYRSRYEAGLKQGINKLRWAEYACSASVMIVAIGIISGIYDAGLLLAMFALTAVMNLLGLVMEIHNPWIKRTAPHWVSYIVGSVAGIFPWVIIALTLIGTTVFGGGGIPAFVYIIYATILLSFGCFAVNMYLQYAKRGKWANYLYGERVYMILSLVAKSLLAWQVFAGALRP